VIGGLVLVAVPLGAMSDRVLVTIVGALALWVVGTADDRRPIGPQWRVLAEVSVAVSLWISGAGFAVVGSGPVDFGITVLWVIAIVNAFNLMDNLDGASSSVAVASAAGVGTLALLTGQVALAALAFALAGACAGFLPHNLAGPARIFLGDGGSMPVGLLIAAGAMAVTQHAAGPAGILGAVLLAGLPILDTTLVVISRTRRGISVLTGGRDHLSHRLLSRLGTPRRVALALAGSQSVLCAAAVISAGQGPGVLAVVTGVCIALGLSVLWILEATFEDDAARPSRPLAYDANSA